MSKCSSQTGFQWKGSCNLALLKVMLVVGLSPNELNSVNSEKIVGYSYLQGPPAYKVLCLLFTAIFGHLKPTLTQGNVPLDGCILPFLPAYLLTKLFRLSF